MPSEAMKDEMHRFGQASYDNGYEQGYRNQPYTGKTFIGYYGWLDGKEQRSKNTA